MKRLLIVLVVAGLPVICAGQVNFMFLPELYGKSVEGLGTFQVQNLSGGPLRGQVLITVSGEGSRSGILTITTPIVTFPTGISDLPRVAFANSVFRFANNAVAMLVNQTRNFPAGDYTFCFRFINADKTEEEYENCYDASVQPLVPIELIYPADADLICDKRPALTWQPPIPFHPAMRFRLLLTEKKRGETIENLLMNTPLVLLDNITASTITYPSFAPDLQEGKTYCWQVIVHQQGVIVSRSEIWEFTVQCMDPVKLSEDDSYRELKVLMNGNYYIAKGTLKFTFRNDYNLKKLNYTILDMSEGAQPVKYTPEIPVQPGLNRIDLDLQSLDMHPGGQYLLRVYPFNEPAIDVRFIYGGND
jgi:hypothetical protein